MNIEYKPKYGNFLQSRLDTIPSSILSTPSNFPISPESTFHSKDFEEEEEEEPPHNLNRVLFPPQETAPSPKNRTDDTKKRLLRKSSIFSSDRNNPLIKSARVFLTNLKRRRSSLTSSFKIPFNPERNGLEMAETLLQGPVAPSDITDFQWANASLTIHKGFKKLIRGCYGHARQGELVVILGDSESEKSHLLKLISQRVPIFVGKRKSKLSINGCQFKRGYLRESTTFVRKEDIFHEIFTAKELLAFASLLRVTGPTMHRENVVEGILRDFNLMEIDDVKVQDYEGKGISGIAKRKISIAMEILDQSGIVLIDNVFGDTRGEIKCDRLEQFELLNILKKEAEYLIVLYFFQERENFHLHCLEFVNGDDETG